MKIPYRLGKAATPLPSLRGSRQRPRPLHPIRVTGPAQSVVRDALLDTGSDDTVFHEALAPLLGLDLSNAPQLTVHLAGRGGIRCRYASVLLWMTDFTETYEWTAVVGFVPTPLQHPLLGFAGFYEFFDVDFRGANREVILTPSWAFTGKRI